MSRQRFDKIEDLDVFFNGIFSEDCLIEKTTNIIGIIFDESFNDIAIGSDILGESVVVSIKNEDMFDNEVEKNDILIIRDKKYLVKNIKLDGNGVSELELGHYDYDYE